MIHALRSHLATVYDLARLSTKAPDAPKSTPFNLDIPTDDEVIAFLDKCYEEIHPANEWSQHEIDHHRRALIAFLRYRAGDDQ